MTSDTPPESSKPKSWLLIHYKVDKNFPFLHMRIELEKQEVEEEYTFDQLIHKAIMGDDKYD